MNFVIRTLDTALAMWVAVRVLPGLDFTGSAIGLIVIALVVGVVNALVRPLMTLLALPFILLTFGLFIIVVNAAALALAIALSGALGLGLSSDGFGWTLLASLVVSLVSWALSLVIPEA
jgi:putative membrane protein